MTLEELEKEIYKKNPSIKKTAKTTKPIKESGDVEDVLKKGWETSRMEAFREKKSSRQRLLRKFSVVREKIKSIYSKITEYRKYSRLIFWGLVTFILVLLAISGFYIYQYFTTTKDVAFAVEAPKEVKIGAPFDLKVQLNNQSQDTLKKVELSIILPEDMVAAPDNQSKTGIVTLNLGDLDQGGSIQKKIPLVIFGNEQTIKRFKVSFSYLPSKLGGRLKKYKDIEVIAGESGIKLDLMAPKKVMNNEEFEILVRYSNISNVDFYGAKLKFIFPQNFIFKDSEPKMINKQLFEIGDLLKGANGELRIRAAIIGEEGKYFEIKSEADLSFLNAPFKINEKIASILIAPSPLSLKISVNGSSADYYVSSAKDKLKYTLTYSNNAEVGLQDAIIKARLTGEMFDFSSLETSGFFSSTDNTITWNAANTPELRLIAPGSKGEISFEINTRENYPIRKKSDKNFILKVQAEITSPTVPYYVTADKSVGLAILKNKVSGNVQIENHLYFKEPTSDIINKGSLPLKVNIPTNFTIHWIIKNYSTDITNVKVHSFLQSGIRWTGVVKSNISSQPVYNERTQEVTWFIDKIAATKGVISEPVEAIFQIEATPNITQINSEMPITGETKLEAIDDFTGVKLQSTTEGIKTGALEDTGLKSQDTKVTR